MQLFHQLISSNKLKRNIVLIFAVYCCINCSLITPIQIPFYKSFGLSYLHIFILNLIMVGSAFAASTLIAPLASLLGHKRSMIIVQLFYLGAPILFTFMQTYFGFILANICYAFGVSTSFAILVPHLNCNLYELDEADSFAKSAGWLFIAGELAYAAGALISGLLGEYSFNAVLIVWFLIELLGLIFILTMTKIDKHHKSTGFIDSFKVSIASYKVVIGLITKSQAFFAILITSILFLVDNYSTTFFTMAYMFQSHFSILMFGITFMLVALLLSIVYYFSNAIENFRYKTSFVCAHLGFMLIFYVIMGLFKSPYVVIPLILQLASFGVMRIYIYFNLQRMLSKEHYSMVTPFMAVCSSLLGGSILIPISIAIEHLGISVASFLMLTIFTCFGLIQFTKILKYRVYDQ